MKRKQHITAFYLETLLMIVVFISIILVLTRVFGSARVQSVQAKELTTAVTLAQNTAEAVSASGSPQELQAILEEDENSLLLEGIRPDADQQAAADAPDEVQNGAEASDAEKPDGAESAASEKPDGAESAASEKPDGAESSASEKPDSAAETAATLYVLCGADMRPLQISQQKEAIETWHTKGGTVKMPGSGALLTETRWIPAASEDRAGLVDAKITVYSAESGREVYSLNTSVYLP